MLRRRSSEAEARIVSLKGDQPTCDKKGAGEGAYGEGRTAELGRERGGGGEVGWLGGVWKRERCVWKRERCLCVCGTTWVDGVRREARGKARGVEMDLGGKRGRRVGKVGE